jgi:hypothetical protein
MAGVGHMHGVHAIEYRTCVDRVDQTSALLYELAELDAVNGLCLANGAITDAHVA